MCNLLVQASCGEVTKNNNNNPSVVVNNKSSTTSTTSSSNTACKTRHRRTMDHPQPAVGVAAVAAACKTCRPPVQRGLGVQQPWAGVPAPAQCSVVPSGAGRSRGVTRAVEPGPEHAASRRALPAWGHTTGSGAVKRSRTSLAQDVSWTHYLNTQVRPDCASCLATQNTKTPQEATWPSAAADHGAAVRLQPPVGKDCVGVCCKNCPTDWESTGYYAPAQCLRTATTTTEENSRLLWNNESMLRLFQV